MHIELVVSIILTFGLLVGLGLIFLELKHARGVLPRIDKLAVEALEHTERAREKLDETLRDYAVQRAELKQLANEVAAVAASGKVMPLKLPIGAVEVYLDYKVLPVQNLASLLQTVENLYNAVYAATLESADASVSEWLRAHPEDRLEIAGIRTGDSIRYQFKTGWLPSMSIDEGDILIELPRGVAIALIVGYLLQNAVSFSTSEYKSMLEITELRQNIERNKKLDKKLEYEIQELKSRLQGTEGEQDEEIKKELNVFLALTVRNHGIMAVKVDTLPKFHKPREFSQEVTRSERSTVDDAN